MDDSRSHSAPACVLIVDDDLDIREALADLLSNEGYAVETAETGKEGLDKARQRPFGAVLLDIGLPDIDGITVLKSLVESHPKLPVIILTAYTHSQQTIDSLSKGAFAYLTKPYNRDELRAILRRAVGVRALALKAEQTESALVDSEERMQLAMEAARLGTWEWDIPNDRITFSNNLRPFFGQPSDACLPTYETFLKAVHPDDRPRVAEAVRQALEVGTAYALDFRTISHDGTIRWIYDRGQVIRDGSSRPVRMLGVAMDITERKLAEENLVRQQIEQQVLLDLIPAMVWYKDLHNRIIRANRLAAESVNRSVAEVEGQSTYDLYPEEAEQYYQDDLTVISSGRPKLGIIELYQTASGEKRWVKTDKVPYRDPEGKVIGVLVFAQDITEHKRADDALRKERDYSAWIIQSTSAIVCGIAPDGATTFVNPAGERITGYCAEELLGRNWWRTFYPGEEYRQVERLFRNFTRGDVRDYEMALRTRSGEKRTIAWNSFNRLDADGNIVEVIGFGSDVTPR
jgi:PAS domain S-box-containing protein